jgi:MFS family permease
VPNSAEGFGYAGWRVTGGTLVALAFGYSAYISYYFGVFLPPLAREFGWSRGALALAVSLGNLTTMLAAPALGWAADRFGARRLILTSITTFALAVGALGAMPGSLTAFYVLHIVVALAALGTLPLTYTAILVRWFDRRRGLALGIALAGVGLGGAVAAPLLAQIVAGYGWRSGYFALSIAMLAVALPIALLLIRDAPGSALRASSSESADATNLWGNHVFRTLLFVFVALGVMTLGVSVHLVALLTDAGLAPSVAASGASILGLSLIAGRIVAGPLLDRVHAPFVAAAFVALATCGLVLLASGSQGATLYLAIALIGLGIGAEFDFMSFLISRYLGPTVYGRAYGLTYAAFQLGCAIGPVLLGTIFDSRGDYAVALWVVAGGTTLAAIALARLPSYAVEKAVSTG